MPGWGQRPLFRNPTNMTHGGSVGMPKGIAGYETGGIADEKASVAYDGSPRDFSRDLRPDDISPQSAYENAIQSSAASFAKGGKDSLDRWENKELDTLAMNISYGHNREKQEVLQDLKAAIYQQSANMPPEQGIMDMVREKMGGSMDKFNQLGDPKDVNFAPTGMNYGGIVGLQNGGMAPELFEDEGIVDTNSMLNEMAAQESGDGIMSVSARGAPEAMPERGVPNERGIIELAMEPELAEEVEDDNPILAFAKQEAQSRLDEEFNILKSTAQAEAASGNPPSAVIKSSMDDLARSARRIETETVEKYPEVPMNANLISSDDLVSYREELVTIFETPEVGQEEPLMDMSILTAKRGGLIPGYEDGGEVPEEWSWIDEDIRQSGVSLKEAESIMIKKYGPEVAKMRKMYATETAPETLTKRRMEERLLTADELIKRRTEQSQDTRIADLIKAMKTGNFMGSTEPKKIPLPGGTNTATMPMGADTIRSNMDLLRQYGKSFNKEGNLRPMPIELEEIVDDAKNGDQGQKTVDQGQGAGDQGLPFQGNGQDIAAVLNAAKEAGYSEETALELIKMMQQGDPLAAVKAQAETLKGTYEKGTEDIVSILDKSIGQYEKDAKKQDKDMRNIFDDIERRIPEQAKYAALTSAASSAGGKGTQYWTRKFNRKSFEENLYQTNNKNKIAFENLRKQETEARRNQDVKALYDIKLKQMDILSGIDETMLKSDEAVARLEIENQLKVDLEKLKAELGTADPSSSTPAAIWADLIKSGGKDLSSREDAIKSMMLGGDPNAQYIIDKGVLGKGLQGTKTIKGKERTFIDLYRSLIETTFINNKNEKVKHTSRTIVEAWLGV